MNAPIFRRVLWKEAREGAGLWIAMAAGGAMVAGLHRWSFAWRSQSTPTEADAAVYGLVLLFVALYAAACGATIFSVERESGTFHFLRALPVAAWRIVLAKSIFAAAATAALFAALWGIAAALSQVRPSGNLLGGLALTWSVAAAQSLAWGVFFSLRCRRPMVAVLLAVTAASISVNGLAIFFGNRSGKEFESYVLSAPASGLVVVAVAVADVFLARRWFHEEAFFGLWLPWRRRSGSSEAAGALGRRRLAGFGRLVWQEARESAVPMAALVGLMLLVLARFLGQKRDFVNEIERGSLFDDGGTVVLGLSYVLFAALAGSMAFLADWRRHQFRFLAERGVGPRAVWLSRLVVWAAPLAITLATFLLVTFLAGTHVSRRIMAELLSGEDGTMGFVGSLVGHRGLLAELLLAPGLVGCGLVLAGIGFAAGQFWSMFTRSGIVAAAAAVFSTWGLAWWAGLMIVFSVPWLWSVAPLGLALLLATWLDAPDWLLERTGWRRRLRRIACVGVPAAAILVAVPLYRAFSVPVVEPGFSVEEFLRPDTPEERATLELYAEAVAEMAPWDSVGPQLGREPEDPGLAESWDRAKNRAQVDASPKAVELALAASRRPTCGQPCDFGWRPGMTRRSEEIHRLADLLRVSGQIEQSKGQLDAARDRYLGALRIASHLRRGGLVEQIDADDVEGRTLPSLRGWSRAPGQTPKRLSETLAALKDVARTRPSRFNSARVDYVQARAFLEGDPATRDDAMGVFGEFLRWAPWERTRARRVLSFMTSKAMACEALCDAARREGGALPDCRSGHGPAAFPLLLRWSVFGEDFVPHFNQSERALERERRFTAVFLALEAWTLEHGHRPDSLDRVVATHFDALPVNPFTGQPFHYQHLDETAQPELHQDWER